jgi:DMSO/TMAO reductase YedYZ molybdopterin-dependent catalytic subunit
MTLRIVTTEPLNAEAPLAALAAPVTSVEDFYVRSNFPAPDIDPQHWSLRVHGQVRAPVELTLEDVRALPNVTKRVTLECAGNGRRLMTPTPRGTAWELGAAGTADFTGTPLRELLALTGPEPDAVECVFTGADSGNVDGRGPVKFQRSLTIEHAGSDEPLIAWEMSGAPLTRDHGFPVRLVVPRFYAVASVKWLVDIDVVDHPFRGYFQADRYVYRGPGLTEHPVTTMRVRSLITSHTDGQRVPDGGVLLAGVAWSGEAAIVTVRVRVDREDWREAELEAGPEEAKPGTAPAGGVMTRWRCECRLDRGDHDLLVVATDAAGNSQPLVPEWNELGYGNNVAQGIRLRSG